jgi:salicylate hydroxylase
LNPSSRQDPVAGVFITQDGTKHTADVIIGADGIRSAVRPLVVPGHKGAQPTGESAYRCMLTVDDLRSIDHPLLDNGQIPQQVQLVVGPQRKIIAYPCRGVSVINCVAYVRECRNLAILIDANVSLFSR